VRQNGGKRPKNKLGSAVNGFFEGAEMGVGGGVRTRVVTDQFLQEHSCAARARESLPEQGAIRKPDGEGEPQVGHTSILVTGAPVRVEWKPWLPVLLPMKVPVRAT
jgi:hypothetical protein